MAYSNISDPRSKAAKLKYYEANKQSYLDRNAVKRREMKSYVLGIKNVSPCTDCGIIYIDEPWLTDFDHISDDKVGNVARVMRNGSMRLLKEEIEKCELVCLICHRRRTAKRANWTP